ncbi:MAG: spore coat protein [Clostridia bacterium]|nr:spore coat protein [Clostridia bacterium]
MTLTQKETSLLKDMQSQEKLCIEKYQKYGEEAKSSELSALFSELTAHEQTHLQTITAMLDGNTPTVSNTPLEANDTHCVACHYESEADRKADAFLCQDALAMEKHVSSLYDVGVFEFSNPAHRKMLNHIQSEEQQHGQQLYAYMSQNQMYG